ncbi:hypothetical protein M2146_001201, partial [Lachnospiraceae bacterium PF1-22]
RLRRSDKASAFYSAPSRSEDLPPGKFELARLT